MSGTLHEPLQYKRLCICQFLRVLRGLVKNAGPLPIKLTMCASFDFHLHTVPYRDLQLQDLPDDIFLQQQQERQQERAHGVNQFPQPCADTTSSRGQSSGGVLIRTVDCCHNLLQCLPRSIKAFSSLATLRLSYNQLTDQGVHMLASIGCSWLTDG